MSFSWINRLHTTRFFLPSLIVLAGVAVAYGLSSTSSSTVTQEPVVRIISVDAIRLVNSPLTMTVEPQGEVVAKTRTSLVAEVSGVVTSIDARFVAGGTFNAGDVLVTIDDRNYLAEVQKSRASVATSNLKLAEQEGLAAYVATEWQSSRVGAQPSDLALRKPQINEAKANLAFSEADLIRKQGDLQRTRLQAPYDGLVEARNVNVGQYVTPGTPMGVIFAMDVVEVRLPIPLHDAEFLDLPDVANNDTHTIAARLDSIVLPGQASWEAEIVRVEAVMDRKNRVLYAIAQVRDPYTTGSAPLRVGNYVKASIAGRQFDAMARIPRSAVRPGNKIWIIGSDSRLTQRHIQSVRADEDFVYVDSGVEDGELLLMTPLDNPLPGMQVNYTLLREEPLLDKEVLSNKEAQVTGLNND
jgi:RND family efflux transporter MFP subunit